MFFAVALKYTVCHYILSCPFLLSLKRLVLQKVGFEIWEYLLRKMGYGRAHHNCVRVTPQNNISIYETFMNEAREASMPFQDNLTLVLLQGSSKSVLKVTGLQNIVQVILGIIPDNLACCLLLEPKYCGLCCLHFSTVWLSFTLLSPGPSWRRDSYLVRLPHWAKKWNK